MPQIVVRVPEAILVETECRKMLARNEISETQKMGKRKGEVKSLPFLFLGYQVEVCYMNSIDHLQVTPPSQFKIQQVRGWVVSLFERGIVYWPNAEITEYPVPI